MGTKVQKQETNFLPIRHSSSTPISYSVGTSRVNGPCRMKQYTVSRESGIGFTGVPSSDNTAEWAQNLNELKKKEFNFLYLTYCTANLFKWLRNN